MTALSLALAFTAALAYDLARRYLARPSAETRRIDELARRIVALEAAGKR